jgi:hypothetical protein
MKVIKGLLLAASLLTTSLLADNYLGIGYGYQVPGEDRGDKPSSLSFIMEEDLDYPWGFGVQYTTEYEVYRVDIKEHLSIFVDKRIVDWDISNNVTMYVAFGLAAHSEKSIVNSSEVNFSERIGLEFDNFRISAHHTSNAGIVPPNEGETMITVEYKYDW